MKQHLGKLLLIILFTFSLHASGVKLELKTPAIYKGDYAQFTIKAEGNSIDFPTITQIEGFPVHTSGTSSSFSNINGKVSQTIAKSYTFKPTKEVTIPSFNVTVDGKNYTTKPQKISVLKPQAGKSGDPYILELKVGKKELKVGESTTLKIIYKQRADANADRITISEPKIDNFWVKKLGNQKQYREGNYIVTEYDYLIFAQKPGKFHIKPIIANIGKFVQRSRSDNFFNDPFFNSMFSELKWQKVYSNDVTIQVEPLPNGLELYGDFNITASADKQKVYADKPVNLTIKVEGIGNIDDVQKFDLNIENAVVYADKPKIKSFLKNGEYGGIFTQKIAIIADRNYTIPPVKLQFFSKKENKIKTIQTKAIPITVIGGTSASTQSTPKVETASTIQTSQAKQPKVITKEVEIEKNPALKYILFIAGFILGATAVILYNRFKNRGKRRKENDIIKQIKNTKDNKKLFDILLPYANDDEVIAQTLKALEENIYKGAKNKIDKQKLYDYFLDLEEQSRS